MLLSAAAVVAGVIAYGGIPIAALPRYDTPTISVSANLPGASPETMAAAATPAPAAVSPPAKPRLPDVTSL